MEKVYPKAFTGYNMSIMQLFGSGPKYTITCGKCNGTFKKRVPMIDNPGISCQYCKTINVLPITITEG